MADFEDKTDQVKATLKSALEKGLLQAAGVVHGDAVLLCPYVTGNLSTSLDFQLDPGGESAEIGTNVEYAPLVEFGRHGRPGKPYLRPALDNHKDNIPIIISAAIKRGLGG